MTWTKEHPTAKGWYLVSSTDEEVWLLVVYYNGKDFNLVDGNFSIPIIDLCINDRMRFAGPIELPKE